MKSGCGSLSFDANGVIHTSPAATPWVRAPTAIQALKARFIFKGLTRFVTSTRVLPSTRKHTSGVVFTRRTCLALRMNSPCLNRRQFLCRSSLVVSGACLGLPRLSRAAGGPANWDPSAPFITPGRKLNVQPVFMCKLPTRKEASSWKSWGGVQTDSAMREETARIEAELKQLALQADFGLAFRPLLIVSSAEALRPAEREKADVTLLYACSGGGELLQACLGLNEHTVIFVRCASGPTYYWYEALSSRLLSTDTAGGVTEANAMPARPHVDDVVVDDPADLLWRLRGLHGLKNFVGTRIVALGGPWGKYAPDAAQKAQERFGLKIVDVSYDDFGPRIRRALADQKAMASAEDWVRRYLAVPGTALHTERKFVVNAFVLYRLFKDLLEEHQASAFTIKSCMGTILPMAETTACLSLSLMNDEGAIAFCESDFVIIPAGLLLRHIARKPVFLHNSTFPHKGIVTCAHCTSPRRLDGQKYEPAEVLTHFESEYGAAPKVDMPIGQEVTFVDPEYSKPRWLGFKGTVKSNPAYDICRSQQDVLIQGDWRKLVPEVRDSHWVMAYGDYLRELGYAARKLGLHWETIAAEA